MDILKMLLVSYLLSLSIHTDLRYNVNTHSDANFTWNVLVNHLTSRSESMVHYQSLYLTKLAFKCAHMSFKSENTNSIWKYQSHLWKYPSHLWKYPSHLSENGEMSINQVGLKWCNKSEKQNTNKMKPIECVNWWQPRQAGTTERRGIFELQLLNCASL